MIPTINMKETGINIRKIMDKYGFTVKDIQNYLGLASVQSVYHWLNGISMPTIDNLYSLSYLFQIPIDEMICGNRKKVDKSMRRVYTYYMRLSERQIA